MHDSGEHTLIERARAGDEEALVSLLERHAPQVRRALRPQMPRRWRHLLSDDDVMQQTYVDAFRDVARFAGGEQGAFAGWLAALARRNLLDAVRMLEAEKRGGRPASSARSRDESLTDLHERVAASSTTPSRIAAGREARAALDAALTALPRDYRAVVEGLDLQGRPAEAVARELGRSPGAVYMLRARAHRLLAEMLGSATESSG